MCSRFLRACGLLAALAGSVAAAEARDLRICADPNNLPFSHANGSGFENRIALLIAEEMGATVRYMWHASRRGFLRNTLNAGACDVVMGMPIGIERVTTTRPYYRSSYVFVQRTGQAPIRSYDDPRLKKQRVGVHLVGDDGANTPPAHHLARRGIVENVRGFMIYGDYRSHAPLEPIMSALAGGGIDVAVAWGPIAGYFASREKVPLMLTPVTAGAAEDQKEITFAIAAGVRRDDAALAAEIGRALERRRTEIAHILDEFGVPRLPIPGDQP